MYNAGNMEYADVTLPKPQVHAKHPFRNPDTHERLLQYIQSRLMRSKSYRDSRLERLTRIDREVAGWIMLDEDDKARAKEERRTGIPQAIKMNLPLTFVHLDDMMTYFLQTFAPSRGMFYQTGGPSDTDVASQIVTLMNNHAIYGGYYRELVKAIFAILKYQRGGFEALWAKDTGPKLETDGQGKDVVNEQIVWQGNRIEALDEYNVLLDPSVDAVDVHREGEWAGKVRMVSHYWLQSRAAQGIYFNCDELLENCNDSTNATYYVNPPSYTKMHQAVSGGQTNWVQFLNEGVDSWQGAGYELVHVYIRLNPWQMDLIPKTKDNIGRNRYEIWRFTIANDQRIIEAAYMNNIHGHIPYYYGVTKDDSMADANKSAAEIISPLSKFGSFLLNSHIAAWRKKIYGITIYDPSMIEMKDIPEGEVAAQIPLKPSGYGKDVRTAWHRDTGNQDDNQTMQDLDSVMNIINQFFPTQSLPSQIAGIDRAIDSQVAAVQQGANRRMQKDARMMDDTMMRPFRFCAYYNIIQYQPDNVSVNDFYGKQVDIDLSALRATDLPFIVGQGLKAIDLQAAAAKLQQVIFALIQNPQAAAQIDLLGLIDYWTSLIDIDVNMKQFHIPQAAPGAVGPDGQPIAGAPTVPITAPSAVTGALNKSGVTAPAGGPPA